MHYIIGLGNPGEKYKNTRHNVGWLMLDYFVTKIGLPSPVSNSSVAGRISGGVISGEEIMLLYPETFMNNSGTAVKKLVSKAEVDKLVVVYDDVDLPVGEVKISIGKGDGGHNGIKSIISSLGSKDFVRVRVGIASVSFWTGKPKRPTGGALPKFVLKEFSKKEIEKLEEVKDKVSNALKIIIESGVEKAMNKVN
ncbi:MAG: aminoacyl-tRNA hydrolase [Candidatus Paceibacterota bacterium]